MEAPPKTIEEAIGKVYSNIDAACEKYGRNPKEVVLCIATKTRTMEEVREAWKWCREESPIMGENQVQSACGRVEDGVNDEKVDKHFIGHLQSNKVNHILTYADCIQTVDSMKLADKLHSRLEQLDRTLRVYIQVNTSGEEQKSGCQPDEAVKLAVAITTSYSKRITVEGLMTIGVNSPDDERVAACFRTLRELKDEINNLEHPSLTIAHLSMGMSGDMDLAIREGSTMVRVGTAIFGARDYSK